MVIDKKFEYDVVFSFAGAQRDYVERVKNALNKYDISVFYDKDNSVDLWGKNLYRYLDKLYQKAQYCVMFISKEYSEHKWTIHESQAAQERAFRSYDSSDFQEYILPVRFDDTQIPGIHITTACMDANKLSPEDLAKNIAKKLEKNLEYVSFCEIFKEIQTLFKEYIKNISYLIYNEYKNFFQIIDRSSDYPLISVCLKNNCIVLELLEASVGNHPDILIFEGQKSEQHSLRIVDFSYFLLSSPEKNVTVYELFELLQKNISLMLEVSDDTIYR